MPLLPRLRHVRSLTNLTQIELADASGVARGTIQRIESLQRGARISTIRKLAKALKVRPRDLMDTGESEPNQ